MGEALTAVTTRPATRTEVEVCADAVMLMAHEGVIRRDVTTLTRVCDVLGIGLSDLREADLRRERGYARPPEHRLTLIEPIRDDLPAENVFRGRPQTYRRTRTVAEFQAEAEEAASERAHQAASDAVRTATDRYASEASERARLENQPRETVQKAICTRCGRNRIESEFAKGSTVCKLCIWRKARRTRWLADLGSAVLDTNDDLIGSGCGVCGAAFKVGDWVTPFDVVMAHKRCSS